jgi:hypothetical protein
MSPENLSRRAILAGAVSVPALALPAAVLPATIVATLAPAAGAIAITGPNPDAELLDLVQKYFVAYAEHGRLIDEVGLMEEKMFAAQRAAEKARPDVLRRTSVDRNLGLPLPNPDRDGKFRFL